MFQDGVRINEPFAGVVHWDLIPQNAIASMQMLPGSNPVFGLIHGFGFASVLTDLGLPRGSLLLALVAFNVGVEIGQLAIVAVFLPFAWAMRRTWAYRRAILGFGSLGIIAIASAWFVERAFDVKLISQARCTTCAAYAG